MATLVTPGGRLLIHHQGGKVDLQGIPRQADGHQGSANERGDRKSTRLNSSHVKRSRMPSSA